MGLLAGDLLKKSSQDKLVRGIKDAGQKNRRKLENDVFRTESSLNPIPVGSSGEEITPSV